MKNEMLEKKEKVLKIIASEKEAVKHAEALAKKDADFRETTENFMKLIHRVNETIVLSPSDAMDMRLYYDNASCENHEALGVLMNIIYDLCDDDGVKVRNLLEKTGFFDEIMLDMLCWK